MPTKKKIIKKTKKKKIDIYDTDHPFRRTAIDIINTLLEPLMQRGINGRKYYSLEDDITEVMWKRLKPFISKIELDITESAPKKKIILDEDYDEDDEEETCNCGSDDCNICNPW